MKIFILTTVLSLSCLAQASDAPDSCFESTKGVAIAFAENRNNQLVNCSAVSQPQFESSGEPGAGTVTVQLMCEGNSQVRVNMVWMNDSDGGCQYVHKVIKP